MWIFVSLKKRLGLLALTLPLLASCASLFSEVRDCTPLVTAPELGVRQTVMTDNGFEVIVRLNGVEAFCSDIRGDTRIEIHTGLKIMRNLRANQETDRMEVPLIFVPIDAEDKALTPLSTSYRVAFGKDISIVYPLVKIKLDIPKDGRVILSLVPEPIKID